MDDREIIIKAKQIKHLTNKQLLFIVSWFSDVKDKEFGFRDTVGFQAQLTKAIDFYLSTELEWQNKVLKNETSLPFLKFFQYTAVMEGIDLPDDFNKKIKGETDEIQGT